MYLGEGILDNSQTLWGVLATLLALCIFADSSSNFIVEFAKRIACGGLLNLKDRIKEGERVPDKFDDLYDNLENDVNKLKTNNPRAEEINEAANQLLVDIQKKRVNTQIWIAFHDQRISKFYTRLENNKWQPAHSIFYMFLYSLVILLCDVIPGMTHLFVISFSLLSAVFCFSPWFCRSSIGYILRSRIIFWTSVVAFAIGQVVYMLSGCNDSPWAYLVITIVPALFILCCILSKLYRRLVIPFTAQEEFVMISMLTVILLALLIAGCCHLHFQESVIYDLLCCYMPLLRIGIVIFVFTVGLIIPFCTPLMYSFTIYTMLYDKLSVISLFSLKQRISDLSERYDTLLRY
ncbi:MAG: hypothetical protein LBC81_00505 [Tannerellaceae bacterium]|jgi:hypothetical protein|nr:hypothetical protein [Tannerellaceae bacterium]